MINKICCLVVELPGVALVIPNELYKVQTTRSWDYLQLSSHYQTNFLQKSKLGEDVIIGLFDTGHYICMYIACIYV